MSDSEDDAPPDTSDGPALERRLRSPDPPAEAEAEAEAEDEEEEGAGSARWGSRG